MRKKLCRSRATAEVGRDGATDVVCPGGTLPAVVVSDGNGDGLFQPGRRIPLR